MKSSVTFGHAALNARIDRGTGGCIDEVEVTPTTAAPYSRRAVRRVASITRSSCANVARASAYSTKPVRVVVPFAAGGPNDLIARLIAQSLSESLSNLFYVENIGGNVGTGQAARATPDGQTILAVA